MKILFYGAGVLGSLYAARLREAGHDVSVLARGQRLTELREHGIVLRNASTDRQTTVRVPVVERLAPEDAYDLVVVIVKRNQLAPVLSALVESGSRSDVLFMLNNASGSQPMVNALGRERVLLGFPGAGGVREGHVIRSVLGPEWLQRMQPTTFAELDGNTSPRLAQIMQVFREAGFAVAANSAMDAWLKTHAAVVVSIGAAAYAVGGDVRRLARTPDALSLMIRAVRENFEVLRALGVPVTPEGLRVLGWLPEALVVALLRRLLNTKTVEISLGSNVMESRDETAQLADELKDLARAASVLTPAADRLREHLNPARPLIPEETARTPVNWGVMGTGVLGAVVGMFFVLKRLRG